MNFIKGIKTTEESYSGHHNNFREEAIDLRYQGRYSHGEQCLPVTIYKPLRIDPEKLERAYRQAKYNYRKYHE